MTEKMQMNRRELLMLSAAGAALSASAHAFGDTRGAGAASGLLGNAPSGRQSKRNEVDFQNDELILYFQMPGAWDVCLAWDPKDRNSVTPGGLKVTDQPYEFGQLERTAGKNRWNDIGPCGQPPFAFCKPNDRG